MSKIPPLEKEGSMTAKGILGKPCQAASLLAQELAGKNLRLPSLQLDYPELVARLEKHLPLIEALASGAVERLKQMEGDWWGLDNYSRLLSTALDVTEEDGYLFCLLVLTTALMLAKSGMAPEKPERLESFRRL